MKQQTEYSSSPPTSNTEKEETNKLIVYTRNPLEIVPFYQMPKKEKDKQSGTPDQETARIFLSLVATAFPFILLAPPNGIFC